MKFSVAILFLALFLSFNCLLSQTENWGPPVSKLLSESVISPDEIESVDMPIFDFMQCRYEDSINDLNKIGPWRFGYSHEVNFNLNNSGTWETIPGRGRLWRLKIHSEGAMSLNFLFENMFIPENGGYIVIYDENEEENFFYYTSQNNLDHKKLGTELTLGETAIIEFFEPQNQFGNASLEITNVIHGYRSLDLFAQSMMRALNGSGDCNIDILCPEGNGWEMQAKSVAMIVTNGNGICSGALINNTQNDGTPYFLTANHCGNDPSNWAFRFNWDSPNPSCATTTPSTDGPTNMQTSNGGVFRASNVGSDFFLLEISNPPPASWDIYYSGWDRTDIIPDSVIGIHHPSGDVKKICKYLTPPVQTQFDAGNGNAECWQIPDWTMGVTEGGSSGSPLFDDNHRIIGQLYGGQAACSNSPTTTDNDLPDYYGRFGISWDGASSAERLKDWLDPTGTDTTYIDGYYPLTISDDYDAFAIVVQNLPQSLCGENTANPSLNIRNNGLQVLTSLDIKVDLVGNISTIPWTGNLASGAYENISLGTINFNDGDSILVKIYTVNPNGNQDQNTMNDTIISYIDVKSIGESLNFSIETDCNASENAIFIENDQGILVESLLNQNELADNFFGQLVIEDVCLVEDCYELVITDNGGDGWPSDWLCFSSPNVTITYNSNAIIDESTFTFTDEVRYPFCIGNAFISELKKDDIGVYPNPTKSMIFLDINETLVKDIELELMDLSGRKIFELEGVDKIDLSSLCDGTYLLKIILNDLHYPIKKIIKN
ncbi:MAG: T9SS type A sorting domain-containing protein [Crocinitomicaceae bacterium]